MFTRRNVKSLDPTPVLLAPSPSMSESSITKPVLLLCTSHVSLPWMRELRIVTFGASTTIHGTSTPSITAPGNVTVNPPDLVNVVPTGTPVVAALGNPDDGVG